MYQLARFIVLLIAVVAASASREAAAARDCKSAPVADDHFAELIVSPVTKAAGNDLPGVLQHAGLECVTQLRTGDCLARYPRAGHLEPRMMAPLLKANIHAYDGGAFDVNDQRVIGDVFVNEGVDAPENETVSLPPAGIFSGPRPNVDPDFSQQGDLKAMHAELAWEGIDENWPRPVIAILDVGVWKRHEDLEKRVISGFTVGCPAGNACDGSPILPTDNHGTKVAGIIAADKNGKGIMGTAWNANIVAVNIGASRITDFTASCGVEIALDEGATIINASWWMKARLKLLRKQLLAANDDVVFIAAAGSDRYRISEKHLSYPLLEDLPNVIGVAANCNTDEPLSSSNYSPRYVHVTAPSWAYTTVWLADSNTSSYMVVKGNTSYSTAYVTGAVALLKTRYPIWGHEWLKWRLINTAIFSQRLKHMSESQGRLDLAATMFPVSTGTPSVDRTATTMLDWTRGLRGDMCPDVAIKVRIGAPPMTGQYSEVVASTLNDGSEAIPPGSLPAGTASHIQFLVSCNQDEDGDGKPESDAESPPIVLAR